MVFKDRILNVMSRMLLFIVIVEINLDEEYFYLGFRIVKYNYIFNC